MNNSGFSNDQVNIDDIPQYTKVTYQHVHPAYARIALIALALVYVVFVMIPAVSFWFLSFQFRAFLLADIGLLALALVLFLMGFIAWYRLAWCKRVKYALREHDVILSSGVYWTSQVIQPLKRLQHVEVTQGPLEKRFGLAKLRLFSAGTIASTFIIPGLDQGVAERLREFVLVSQNKVLNNQISAGAKGLTSSADFVSTKQQASDAASEVAE